MTNNRTVVFCNGNPEILALHGLGYSDTDLNILFHWHGIPADIALAMINAGLQANLDALITKGASSS
jgi:hypothetical protein